MPLWIMCHSKTDVHAMLATTFYRKKRDANIHVFHDSSPHDTWNSIITTNLILFRQQSSAVSVSLLPLLLRGCMVSIVMYLTGYMHARIFLSYPLFWQLKRQLEKSTCFCTSPLRIFLAFHKKRCIKVDKYLVSKNSLKYQTASCFPSANSTLFLISFP